MSTAEGQCSRGGNHHNDDPWAAKLPTGLMGDTAGAVRPFDYPTEHDRARISYPLDPDPVDDGYDDG